MENYDDLQVYLSNLALLNTKLHNIHWNVVGKRFVQVHEYTEELYDEFFVYYDEIAEIMKMRGEMPLVKMNDYAKKASLQEEEARDFSCEEALKIVKADLEEMKSMAVDIREAADEVDDFEVVGALEDQVESYSQHIWFLESMLT